MSSLIAKRALDVYYDYGSPFVYIASEILTGLVTSHGLDLTWKPIDLHRLSNFASGMPYSEIKRAYVGVDALRTAEYHGVTLRMPKPFPVESARAMRLAVAAERADCFGVLHQAIARAAWRDQLDISSPDVLAQLITAAGLDGKDLLAAADSPVTTTQLEKTTAEAEALGVFGVPMMVLDGELFWGVDSLPTLAWRLAGSPKPAGPRVLPGPEGI